MCELVCVCVVWCVCVNLCGHACVCPFVCLCVYVCAFACDCVCASERECVCVCVCVCERETDRQTQTDREHCACVQPFPVYCQAKESGNSPQRSTTHHNVGQLEKAHVRCYPTQGTDRTCFPACSCRQTATGRKINGWSLIYLARNAFYSHAW